MRTRQPGRTATLLLLGVVLAGCGGSAGAGAPTLDGPGTSGCGADRPTPSPIETAGATMYGESAVLGEALTALAQSGEGRFRDVYAGVEVVPEHGYAVLYRRPSAELDAYAEQVAKGECIYLRDAAFSHAELLELTQRIVADMGYWKERGIAVHLVGPKHDGSGITVGVEEVEKAQAALPERYGLRIPITVEPGGAPVPL
ncbi:hypothetical protein [Catellatospora sp. NPDC049609]|uniref:hypothetical protein n=1 Tax=Catellatospora sp. NPDC049609 TaxID=3155505 RepID=UPI003415360E